MKPDEVKMNIIKRLWCFIFEHEYNFPTLHGVRKADVVCRRRKKIEVTYFTETGRITPYPNMSDEDLDDLESQ